MYEIWSKSKRGLKLEDVVVSKEFAQILLDSLRMSCSGYIFYIKEKTWLTKKS